jgi:hypothetical protein
VLLVSGLWRSPKVLMGVVSLLFIVRTHLGSHGIGRARYLITVVPFFELLFLVSPLIDRVGIMPSLCWVLVALWGVGHRLSTLLPS